MDRSFTMVHTDILSDRDVTEIPEAWLSPRAELMYLVNDQQLPNEAEASFPGDRFRVLFDLVLMMMNNLSVASIEHQSTTEELIQGLEKQIDHLKTTIKKLEPHFYANSSEDESSPSTPSKRPRLVESGNSTMASSRLAMI